MNRPAKSPQTAQEKSSPNFMGLFKRRLFFTSGLFSVLFAVTPLNLGEPRLDVKPAPSEQEAPGHKLETVTSPLSQTEFGITLSVDCSVLPGKQAGKRFSWTNDAHRPLGLAVNKQGAGSEPYMFIGKKANGDPKDKTLESGYLLSFDKDRQAYTMYSFDVQDRVPNDKDGDRSPDARPEPHIVAEPVEVLTVAQLQEGLSYQFNDLVLDIKPDVSDPFNQLHFTLTCMAPGAAYPAE